MFLGHACSRELNQELYTTFFDKNISYFTKEMLSVSNVFSIALMNCSILDLFVDDSFKV